MDLWGVYLFHLVFIALHEVLSAGRDCLVAGDSCSSDETCSPRLRTLRQCVAGDGSMKLGPGARSQCANAVSALISSPLHGCQCKRGMKKEKNCLSIYWSLHQSVIHGLNLVESYPYKAVERDYDSVRLASITADSEANVATVNRCLDAAKACNVDDLCQKLRTEYVSACIKPLAKSGLCNKAKCNKALRRFFDRVPPAYTHELLFCPCTDMACAERRRQTIVPSCSYEGSDKPSCLIQMSMCKGDYVCRSRLAQFQYDCQPAESSANSCKQGNYGACLLAYTGLIGSSITPNYVDNSTSSVAPWCSCSASGNQRVECSDFLEYFTNNVCLRNALLAFGSRTDVMPTSSESRHLSPATGRESHAINPLPATVETTRNIPESIIPTQVSGNDRLWRDSTLPSDGLPNSAPALGLLPPTSFTGLLVLPLVLYGH
ncbi:GDNF family receptor alpha-4-like isoform X1 [Oncorhynchus kisutch]|uniref:GDNF family receptor alpha 4b n=2 Tax=Oncorhynchus kisutch TaxID=8019 RepID=A0A8C7FAB8_ONCKI|nr:GDNF family receptor alpha-4-like isoform X1 [Oncorhynchus kisutch]XP_031682882.1 GDNF family receptor alpha-4-like isoform X1 [Oncorhynchus kisutch]